MTLNRVTDFGLNSAQLAAIAIDFKTPPAPLVGIKADGVTDDQPALTNIINAFPEGTKYTLPNNCTIAINNTLVINKKIIIQGHKKDSFIKKMGNFLAIQIVVDEVVLRDVALTGVSGNTGNGIEVGSYTTSAGLVRLENVYVERQGGDGVWLRNGNCCKIDIETYANSGHGVHLESNCQSSFGWNTNANNVKCNNIANLQDGLHINASNVNEIFCDSEGNSGIGVYCNAQQNKMFIYCEGNTGGTLKLDNSGYGNQIFGKMVDADPIINNHYNLICANTNSTTGLYLYGTARIKSIGNQAGSATVTGGSIAANSTIFINSAANAYVDSSSSLAFSLTSPLPAGLICQAYPIPASSEIQIALTNVTSSAINLASISWNCVYYNCL